MSDELPRAPPGLPWHVAGGLVASGEVPLAPQNTVGEIVFPLDSVEAPCKLTLTLNVGNTAVRNHWDFEVVDSVKTPPVN